MRYLDLEFAHAEFEVDKFRDEVLGLRFEDLYGEQGSDIFIRQLVLGVWVGHGEGGSGPDKERVQNERNLFGNPEVVERGKG